MIEVCRRWNMDTPWGDLVRHLTLATPQAEGEEPGARNATAEDAEIFDRALLKSVTVIYPPEVVALIEAARELCASELMSKYHVVDGRLLRTLRAALTPFDRTEKTS